MSSQQDTEFLCQIWGEDIDHTLTAIVPDWDGVRRFCVEYWTGKDDATDYDGSLTLDNLKTEFDEHEADERGGAYAQTWEIGGVSVERICNCSPAPLGAESKACASVGVEPGVLRVQEADCVHHVHPEYGSGIFFTEDCILASPAPSVGEPTRLLRSVWDVTQAEQDAMGDAQWSAWKAELRAANQGALPVSELLTSVEEMQRDALEVYNLPETTQDVRDAIEYCASWMTVYIEKRAPIATPPAAPAATEAPTIEGLTEPTTQTEWNRVYGLIRYWAKRARDAEAALATPAPAVGASPEPSDAAVLLGKYKKLCMEIKRGDGYHLARIDKAIAALAAVGASLSPLDRQIARAQEAMKSWSPEKRASMRLQGPNDSQTPALACVQPVLESLSDEQIDDLADDFKSQYTHGGTTFDEFDYMGFGKAVRDRVLASSTSAAQAPKEAS